MLISILNLQFHSLHFYKSYVSLRNRLVKPKVHENVKVKVTSKNLGFMLVDYVPMKK